MWSELMRSSAHLWLMGTLTVMGGCTSLPASRTAACADAARPSISYSADGATAATQIDILTYNIEGLPFPARRNRGAYLREIGERLAVLRAEQQAPDIIVFQEVFSTAAAAAIEASGYISIVPGPSARSRQSSNEQGALPDRRRVLGHGIRSNLTSGGLVIVTDYPVISSASEPFARRSCAGFDCLSNKGALFAEIAIPGVPGAINVFTTHMQSQRSSRASTERRNEAHTRQARELSAFTKSNGDVRHPTIIAGDFNMRNSDKRFNNFARRFPLENVHRFCTELPDQCDVRQEWSQADQWRREQNLHFFESGEFVRVRPVAAEGMFDGGPSGPILADHNGFRVIYELSWPIRGAPRAICPVGL